MVKLKILGSSTGSARTVFFNPLPAAMPHSLSIVSALAGFIAIRHGSHSNTLAPFAAPLPIPGENRILAKVWKRKKN